MKRLVQRGYLFALVVVCFFLTGVTAQASKEAVIKNGIYIGEVNVSGMTAGEATEAVEDYLETLGGTEITLLAAREKAVVITAGELGMVWENPEVIEEALTMGTGGNVIERYKTIKDLEHENLVYPLEISFDNQAIHDILISKCTIYDVEKVDSSLVRKNNAFTFVEGQTGYRVDVETSADKVNNYLLEEWDYQPCTITLDITEEAYRGSAEELSCVQDVLGSYTTAYHSSGASRSANIKNGCQLIDGTLVYPGEEFSALAQVLPFTAANGYYEAGSYLNGKVVDSLGGGICQVTTTLYNAVLLAELEVTERYNHSMTISYAPLAMDAAIAESANKDFKFVNTTDYPIYIEGTVKNKTITFTIYGKETRSENRSISFETEVREVIEPSGDLVTADEGQPIGYIDEHNGYTGYKTTLWKIVTENGAEVSRTQVNRSNYKMVQRTATVGTATADSYAHEQIMAAIGTSNVDHVKNVIAHLTAPSGEDTAEE